MSKIRVTKCFVFEMGHALHNYEGLCRNIHGHSYKLEVTVIGQPVSDPRQNDYGMVIDFGSFKRIVNNAIVDKFDHSIVLNHKEKSNALSDFKGLFDRFIVLEFQPTCENLVSYFAEILIPLLPEKISLHSIKLYETATSYAEWFAEDQPES